MCSSDLPLDHTAFWTCSRSFSTRHLALTTCCAMSQSDALEPMVLISRFISWSRKSSLRPTSVPLSTLLRIPDAFQVQQVADDPDVIWNEVQPVMAEALQQFVAMRETEGKRLADDVAFHLDRLAEMTDAVEKLVPETVQQYYEKLYRKITELLGDRTVDESRLVTEAAVVAEKIAVDEELVRLRSHIAQFRVFLTSTEPVGRKMDFLVQELNREVNTTGSKSQHLEITKLVVDMKSEIEKIREQIQNIE